MIFYQVKQLLLIAPVVDQPISRQAIGHAGLANIIAGQITVPGGLDGDGLFDVALIGTARQPYRPKQATADFDEAARVCG